MKGECNCGAVRFEIGADPFGVFVCHCSICRRHTGTNGNAVLVLSNGEFRWISGEEKISTWKSRDMIGRSGSVAFVVPRCQATMTN